MPLFSTVSSIFYEKNRKAAKENQIHDIAIAESISQLWIKNAINRNEQSHQWKTYIPPFSYCTDNAAMIAITGYYKYLIKEFCNQEISAKARLNI